MNTETISKQDQKLSESDFHTIEDVARRLRYVASEYGEEILEKCSIVSSSILPTICGYENYYDPTATSPKLIIKGSSDLSLTHKSKLYEVARCFEEA
jgi:hypothetical protein